MARSTLLFWWFYGMFRLITGLCGDGRCGCITMKGERFQSLPLPPTISGVVLRLRMPFTWEFSSQTKVLHHFLPRCSYCFGLEAPRHRFSGKPRRVAHSSKNVCCRSVSRVGVCFYGCPCRPRKTKVATTSACQKTSSTCWSFRLAPPILDSRISWSSGRTSLMVRESNNPNTRRESLAGGVHRESVSS